MRQQEANQFDKGLNLDTNPITMDNHTLTGALNATMVTMNGNELVLLNDMGNGRVDQALLPVGYVPVGMLEYGGIVYVASYNPMEGESQIGCFPSPQRNIPSGNLGGTGATISNIDADINNSFEVSAINGLANHYWVKNIKKLEPLMEDILRPGDKFLISASGFTQADTLYGQDYLQIKIVTVDNEGNSIDITDLLRTYTANTFEHFNKIILQSALNEVGFSYADNYNIYKNKASGKLCIQEELILPSYIEVKLSADKPLNSEYVYVTLTPNAYNDDGSIWNTNNISGYYSIVKVDGVIIQPESNGTYKVGTTGTLTYEFYPKYKYVSNKFYVIESLKREGIADIGSIGTGEVKFEGSFKYYNDIVKNHLLLDYNIQSYTEGTEWVLSKVCLEAYDIEDLFGSQANQTLRDKILSNTYTESDVENFKIEVPLNVTNDFGSYSERLEYKANPPENKRFLNKGFYYIAKLKAKVVKTVNNGNSIESLWYEGTNWYAIITSAITNEDYLSASVADMYPLQTDNNLREFTLTWDTNFSREELQSNSSTLLSGDTSNLITKRPENANKRLSYTTTKNFTLQHKYSAETSVNTVSSFPYIAEFNPEINIDNPTYTTNITYYGNTEVLGEQIILPVSEPQELSGITISGSGNDKIVTIQNEILSHLYAKLKINPNSPILDLNDLDKYKFSIEAITAAFVPYIPAYYSEENFGILQQILGDVQITSSTTENSSIQAKEKKWLSYGYNTIGWSATGDWTDSDATRVSNWNKYAIQLILLMKGVIPQIFSSEPNATQYDMLFLDNHRDKNNPYSWSNVSSKISEKFGNSSPTFVFWHGVVNTEANSIAESTSTSATLSCKYGIPMMMDTQGYYCLLNQFGYNNDNTINLLQHYIKAFSMIYVQLSDQYVSFDYWTGSDDPTDYAYNNPYKMTINTTAHTASYVDSEHDYTRSGLTLKLDESTVSNFDSFNKANNEGIVVVDNIQYKFPKFKLALVLDKNMSFTDIIDSPDLSIMNTKLLDLTTPMLGNCAIIKDLNGSTVITNAYKYNSAESKTPTGFVANHYYILCDYEEFTTLNLAGFSLQIPVSSSAILADINTSNLDAIKNTTYGKYGYEIASALKLNKIVSRLNDEGNYKMFYLNSANCSKITNTNYALGDIYYSLNEKCWINVRTKISTLASNYMYDLKLLNETISPFTSNPLRHFN